MDLDEIQQIFFQECEEALLAIESSFGLCRSGDYDRETINTIFRGVHSIKGGAGAFGHDALQGFTHHYETLLDKLRNDEVALTPALLDTLLAAFDVLTDHIAAARGDGAVPADAHVLVMLAKAGEGGAAVEAPAAEASAATVEPTAPAEAPDDFDDIFGMLDGGDAAPTRCWWVKYRPGAGAFDHGGEPLLLLRELQRLGGTVAEGDLDALPLLDALDPTQPCLAWTITLPETVAEDEIRGIFDFIGGSCAVDLIVAQAPAAAIEPISTAEADWAPVIDTQPPEAPSSVAAVAAPEPPALAVVPAAAAVVAAPEPIEASAPAGDGPARGAAAAANQTIRVDLDKLDRLVNLVGELVITQAMLAQRLSVHGMSNVTELTDLDHLTRELQDSAMSIRAQPVKTVFSRVPRIIRELEAHTGKRVRLEMEGEMTEIDKTVVERIGEPLTHLIRNAVDHGIETPAEREAVGKPAEGVVCLSAEHRSGRIVISITDDGRGINRERVRSKAIERGIIPADAVLTTEEIDNLIFAPGFSTAEQVSNISGRGVGMDVVRKNVQALGGRIGIVSTPGQGSTFSLSLPLTLAVLDGMIVRVGDETFVVPLAHIVESLRPAETEVRQIGTASLINVRGSYVPIQNVGRQLGVNGSGHKPSEAVLIVVESDAGQAVLMVDAIQDQRQVVVKSLEANYCAVPGLAGATILGDGRVALILDVDTLVSRWRQEGRAPEALAA
ncbi:chemotaxis protein CheA [Sphingomonas nostoxanthinifaciens]|uniref:chemotaxis protein CheA n=1 Tax=Sphingomonas nostoxanthinifaciens TaxID=2872652 RepID=UPI001CC1EFD2|nr:chemotaxis protein CheA [Sphingomonas nostoxanthinifaciens]UAK26041.1 chemotaxis protein CheA [Sphingomonas nostoxanthinifaciens]